MSRASVVERFSGRIAWTAPEIFALAQLANVPITRFFPDADEFRVSEAAAS